MMEYKVSEMESFRKTVEENFQKGWRLFDANDRLMLRGDQ